MRLIGPIRSVCCTTQMAPQLLSTPLFFDDEERQPRPLRDPAGAPLQPCGNARAHARGGSCRSAHVGLAALLAWRRDEAADMRARPIRVLLAINLLLRGGAERQLVQLATGLDRERFSVSVLCVVAGGPLAQELTDAGIPVAIFHSRKPLQPL